MILRLRWGHDVPYKCWSCGARHRFLICPYTKIPREMTL